MNAKTKSQAIAKFRKLYQVKNEPFWVYQFPKGHWSYATTSSEVGRDLEATGHIYKSLGIEAKQYELINA